MNASPKIEISMASESQTLALGQRLADSTFVELRLRNPASEMPVTCRAVAYRLDWK